MQSKVRLLISLCSVFVSFFFVTNFARADSIPDIPNNFHGVDLSQNFNAAIPIASNRNTGIKYLENNTVLQMSDDYKQGGALWSKTQIDLRKKFSIHFYLYLGNSGSKSGDGMTFTLQGEGTDWVGSYGSGIGAYGGNADNGDPSSASNSEHNRRTFSLEFDTFYNNQNGEYCDGTSSLSKHEGANHIAWCASPADWQSSAHTQWHWDAGWLLADDDSALSMSNGSWKEVTITGTPKDSTHTTLRYSMYDLATKKTISTLNDSGTTVCFAPFTESDPYNTHTLHFFNSPLVNWGFTASTGNNMEVNAMTFGTLPQTASLAAKDTTIYTSQTFDPKDTYSSGTDEEGNAIDWGDTKLTYKSTVDTSKAGNYTVEYTYNYTVTNADGTTEPRTAVATAHVTVKEDKSSITTKSSTLHVGETWDPESNFVSATDKDGNPVAYSNESVTTNGWSNTGIDTSKPGTYSGIVYSYKGDIQTVSSKFTVTVVADQTSITTKNSTIYVGNTSWKAEDNFVSATDEDGNDVPYSDSRINTHGASSGIDTSTAHDIPLKYSNEGKYKTVDSSFTVHVIEPLKLTVPETCDFGSYQLGTTSSPILTWNNDKYKVKVSGDKSLKWTLSVSLSGDSSLKNYLTFDETPIPSATSISVKSGTGANTDVLSDLSSKIKVDYTGVETTRTDSGTLNWTLIPSTSEVKE